jgi:hypothetical protein
MDGWDATKSWEREMRRSEEGEEETGTEKAINNDRTKNIRYQQRKETKNGRK